METMSQSSKQGLKKNQGDIQQVLSATPLEERGEVGSKHNDAEVARSVSSQHRGIVSMAIRRHEFTVNHDARSLKLRSDTWPSLEAPKAAHGPTGWVI